MNSNNTTTSVDTMLVDQAAVTNIISNINSVASELEQKMITINNLISTVELVWYGQSAQRYIANAKNSASKVSIGIEGVKLLGQTFEKVNSTTSETEQTISSRI